MADALLAVSVQARMKDKASRKRRRWEGQDRTIGDESTKRKRKRRRQRRRRRRTRVSQAVITDIGSAIVGATKAHRLEASQDERRKGTIARTEERWRTRGREKDTGQGQRWLRIWRDIHRQNHARSLPTSTHLSFSFFFLSPPPYFSFFLSAVELYEHRPLWSYHYHMRRQIWP